MRLEGRVWKSKNSKYWIIEVPLLELVTQGTSKGDAYIMLKNAIEELVNNKLFKVQIFIGKGEEFTVGANHSKLFIALMLKRLRLLKGLTVREVASRLGSASPNAYAQYEQGKINLTIDKLVELIQAIDPNFEPVLKAA